MGLNREAVGLKTVSIADLSIERSIEYEAVVNLASKSIMNDSVHPFYISSLVYPDIKKLLYHKKLQGNILRMVHGGQRLSYSDRINPQIKVRLESSIGEMQDTPAGDKLVITTVVRDENSRRELLASSADFIFRNKSRKRKGVRKNEEKYIIPQESIPFTIPLNAPRDYARVSGDRNPIHRNYIVARLAGFKRPILHGMCLMAIVHDILSMKYGSSSIASRKCISLRFSGVVYPGDALELEMYGTENGVLRFGVHNNRGLKVIKNGEFIL